MKKIIFRFPTTKQDKIIGENMLNTVQMNLNLANTWCRNGDGTYTILGCELIENAYHTYKLAAKRLGFRNVSDMEEYRMRHGLDLITF